METKKSLICNIIICILEIIGLIILYKDTGILFEFYTVDSNILCLVSSLLLVIFLINNKVIPKWLSIFKYITTVSLTITFVVVIFILIPMTNFNITYLLFEKSMLYQHLLCPILSIITFILFDDLGPLNKKDILKGMLFTFLYSIILIPLNIFDLIVGPYPFLRIKEQTILMNIVWLSLIMGIGFIISYMLMKTYNKKY